MTKEKEYDCMIDRYTIKKLRNERNWSQDNLATISGLSLRTIQRIEREGTCSLESKRALAAAFEVNTSSIEIDQELPSEDRSKDGRKNGYVGLVGGFIVAYIAITISYILGNISSSEAGLYYGGIATFCGLCCAVMAILTNKYGIQKT